MTGLIKVLDRSGHTEVPYDTEVPASLEQVFETIRRAKQVRALAFDTSTKPGTPIDLDTFQAAEHSDVTIVPAFQGG